MNVAEKLLKEVEEKYAVSSEEILTVYSRNLDSEHEDIKLYMEKIPELTADDIFVTVERIRNPKPSDRFVCEVNQVTIYDKEGNKKIRAK